MEKGHIVIYFILFLMFFICGCASSDYVCVKVNKSAFLPDSIELSRDCLIEGGIKICTAAQRYFFKPGNKGGGHYSFEGFSIPAHLDSNECGSYMLSIKKYWIEVTGYGFLTGDDGVNPMEVQFIAEPELGYITTTITN